LYVKKFPEIIKFFVRKSFSDAEVEILREQIRANYKDENTIKAGIGLIELGIIRSKIYKKSPDISVSKLNIKLNNRAVHTKETITKFEKIKNKIAENKKRIRLIPEESKVIATIKFEDFYNKRLHFVAKCLKVSTKRIKEQLELHGYNLRESSLLTNRHVDLIEPWIRHITSESADEVTIVRKLKTKKGKAKSSSELKGAWGKMRTYGIRGKLIYTR
jgi:hypothetical protein